MEDKIQKDKTESDTSNWVATIINDEVYIRAEDIVGYLNMIIKKRGWVGIINPIKKRILYCMTEVYKRLM